MLTFTVTVVLARFFNDVSPWATTIHWWRKYLHLEGKPVYWCQNYYCTVLSCPSLCFQEFKWVSANLIQKAREEWEGDL